MTDRFTEHAIVIFLGSIGLVGLLELGWLVATTDVRDAALLAIILGPTTGAIGALGTLLARVGGNDAQPVQVVNQGPNEAIPVDDTKAKK